MRGLYTEKTRKTGVPQREYRNVIGSEMTVHHATEEAFVSWTLRCAKRENQDLSVLVTRGAKPEAREPESPRPEARKPEVRGRSVSAQDRGVSARSQPEVCVIREVAKPFTQHNTVIAPPAH